MTIKERITEDMKSAMRAHDTARLSALRLLLAAIKQREVDDRVEATDELVTGVIGKLIKQRRDSVKQYTDAGRADLAQKEQDEIDTLSVYMPAPDVRRRHQGNRGGSYRRNRRQRHGCHGQGHGHRQGQVCRQG